MSKLTASFLLIIFFSIKSQAQTITVSGAVEDTVNRKGVQNAVVALLLAKDSVLYRFTRTDADGRYNITNLKAGDQKVNCWKK